VKTENMLRAAEARSLRVASFSDLEGKRPTLTVRASSAKNRREANQPLRADTAKDLAAFVKDRGAIVPAFQLARGWRPSVMIERDLKAARLDYADASGRIADFHALRSAFVSRLVCSHANVKLVQTLARHSSPDMTLGVYAKLGANDERDAIEALESLAPTTTQETQAKGA